MFRRLAFAATVIVATIVPMTASAYADVPSGCSGAGADVPSQPELPAPVVFTCNILSKDPSCQVAKVNVDELVFVYTCIQPDILP